MSLDFYLLCPNPGCPSDRAPIPLLIANLEQRSNDPDAWPNDGSARLVACPACRLVSAHSQADLYDRPEESRNIPEAWTGITLVGDGEASLRPPSRFLALRQNLGKPAV